MSDHVRDLNNSRPLDVHRWSMHPEVNSFVDQLWEQYLNDFFTEPNGKKQRQPTKKQFKVLLLDLYVCWHEDPGQSLGISFRKADYKQGRYNALHISAKTIDIVKNLRSAGLVEFHLGSEAAGRRTRVWPTPKLIEKFESSILSPALIERHQDQECIILKRKEEPDDAASKPMDYNDDEHPRIKEWRRNVQRYNQLLSTTYIDIAELESPWVTVQKSVKGVPKGRRVRIDQDQKFCRRVFYQGSWERGGRFHGGFWQFLNKEMRAKILINHQDTVEIDFSGMHINIAYALNDQPPPKDPYRLKTVVLDGYTPDEQRKIVKHLILMAINAADESKAYLGFRRQQPSGSRAKRLKNKQLQIVKDHFLEEHPLIDQYLFKGMGVVLMNYDGDIAYRVVCNLTDQSIPTLCVHDSFIVEQRHQSALAEAMAIATQEAIGRKIPKDQNKFGLSSPEFTLEGVKAYVNDPERYWHLKNKYEPLINSKHYWKRFDEWVGGFAQT